ncbi:MAG TPA: PA0069 family radical SAM protein [Gemmataceae bacterium]|nr:PA0069 family radical SAM protein [Gemmataceae bacterium]
MFDHSLPIHGRGVSDNPTGRFERIAYERDPDVSVEDEVAPATVLLRDTSRTIIATNDSPDVGFDASINPYRGCEHGCSYCYARPYHEYLGMSAGLDFETKILVKEDAPELLRKELLSPKWQPKVLGISGVTDAYQPIERRLRITRRCLEVLTEFRNPVGIVTKNHLVARDADLLTELARFDAALVFVSVTTLDANLSRRMEPRASHPDARLAAVKDLRAAGVPVGVMVAPIIPGLNDHEVPTILQAAAAAGAMFAHYTILRLPHGVADLFEQWLAQHFPDRKDKVLGRIRDMRGGKLNESDFGKRMRGDGILAKAIGDLFAMARQKAGLERMPPKVSTASFRRPIKGGLPTLFDDLLE